MSDICKSSDNHFTGVSLFSPKYREKAERLLRSCARVGVCCKATQLPSDAFGREAPEGSEAFRFQTIAAKPSFIRDEMDATRLPVAFLDTDLEFHRFPQLFVPGSWPGGGRDVAAFNYWGNETDSNPDRNPNSNRRPNSNPDPGPDPNANANPNPNPNLTRTRTLTLT